MNKANLKSYAPKARLDFIKAVTARANVLGISAAGTVPAEVRGDVALIDGREWPAKVAGQRDDLIARIKHHGFEQTMDEVAYTWFNRFAALRYMEIHDYLGHGWRVLSSRDGGLPEILRHASEVTLPGLNADRAREMQLAGNQDNELYKLLLVAQCNELSRVMPFLFERIDDETELLLPENLLRTDSIVAKLVEQVPEEDWQEIEVIGWLYQFYISEKKDQVIGKVVKSEDIPAATQLFTPNWIVQYLVQNSVGRLWLMANPSSTLASQWPYYIQPAEQTPEVQARLDALIQARIREDGETLNPETITVLDPACGSGHILVVAYDVLKAIYLERGYQPRVIPRLILEKNLYGLDIDDRAAQLAAFALLMKARADDRRLFVDPPRLNVLSLQGSKGLDTDDLQRSLAAYGALRAPINALLNTFEHAKTFGSLIQIPTTLGDQLAAMATDLQRALNDGDLYARQAAKDVLPLVWQALLLGTKFDAVVANPPYMGSKGMTSAIKDFAQKTFPLGKSDLYSIFIERAFAWCKPSAVNAMVTMQNWMFISSYESFRHALLNAREFYQITQVGYNSFPEINSKVVQVCAFVFGAIPVDGHIGMYVNLNNAPQSADKDVEFLNRTESMVHRRTREQFQKIPGDAIVMWASNASLYIFENTPRLAEYIDTREGLTTGSNDRFLRYWHEVSCEEISIPVSKVSGRHRWIPYVKGGAYRRWSGNLEYVVNWENDGEAMKSFADTETGRIRSHNYNGAFALRSGVTWSSITSGDFSVRHVPEGFMFDAKGPMGFMKLGTSTYSVAAFLNSEVAGHFMRMLAPTLDFKIGHVLNLPYRVDVAEGQANCARTCVDMSSEDWRSSEGFWEFERLAFIPSNPAGSLLHDSWSVWAARADQSVSRLRELEQSNNLAFIKAYGLEDELAPQVADSQITLLRPDRTTDCQRLVSYVVGCMMGRYSLDEPGLIYAHASNAGFNPRSYEKKFPADADGIVPINDERWFEDDAASRVRDFLRAVWGAERLEENMAWLAVSLGIKGSETPDEAVGRYLADKFFKDHLQTYKKRPVYWLFSSGKQGAFQALVYLHRYNEGTLARMRAEYVVTLVAKMVSRLDMLDQDVAAASSAAARTKLQKQIEALRKKQIELLAYDEKLRHYADMRITLDLDDGVKVNYAKFGDLVAEAKAITGGSDD